MLHVDFERFSHFSVELCIKHGIMYKATSHRTCVLHVYFERLSNLHNYIR